MFSVVVVLEDESYIAERVIAGQNDLRKGTCKADASESFISSNLTAPRLTIVQRSSCRQAPMRLSRSPASQIKTNNIDKPSPDFLS